MQTDQARTIIAAHDAFDRALANLRNAGAMSTDDPRSKELLEEAGDAYAETLVQLRNGQLEAAPIIMPVGTLVAHARGELGPLGGDPPPPKLDGPLSGPAQPAPSAPGAEDSPVPGGRVQPEADRGTLAEARETIPVPKPEVPADATSAPETGTEGSGQGEAPPAA